jgi:hypothetical protein
MFQIVVDSGGGYASVTSCHNNPFCFEFELEDGTGQHEAPHLSATHSPVYIENRAISS